MGAPGVERRLGMLGCTDSGSEPHRFSRPNAMQRPKWCSNPKWSAMSVVGQVTRRAQTRLGLALRHKVAGDDGPRNARRIWQPGGERWFTSQDPIWRVHEDAAMFPGGVAALLVQMLHPAAMAGVAGHSGYRGDPWGRLARTSTYLATTTFGTIEHAEEHIATVRAVHERVRGKDHTGRAYRASDPHLLMWVHLAEVDSFLRAFQAYAKDPLTPSEADQYVRQTGVSARLLGVLEPPATVDELRTALDGYRDELELTDAARDSARFLLLHPPLPWTARPGYAAILAGGIAVMPDWARQIFGISTSDLLVRAIGGPLGSASTATIRWAMAGVRAAGRGEHDPTGQRVDEGQEHAA